ncbi:MAG TPA: nicotinate (nicotinamide) nucleotide adenylyltransferase [Candidatus Cloacimonadota bacterium]|nr:nicotinate (nicotinamide) nucleotide adenylyltransferase [Candidatus Cloacimonadota bacterium]
MLRGYYAILGGSFDPIHLGHLHIAHQILQRTGVEKLILMPNGIHHFKKGKVVLGFQQRFQMVQDAIAGEPKIEAWNHDEEGSGFTDDLLKKLYALYPERNFCFVIGSDNLSKLPKWHHYSWLTENCHFLLINRPGFKMPAEILSQIKHTVLETQLIDVSSTMVRNRVRSGMDIADLVPAKLVNTIYLNYSK